MRPAAPAACEQSPCCDPRASPCSNLQAAAVASARQRASPSQLVPLATKGALEWPWRSLETALPLLSCVAWEHPLLLILFSATIKCLSVGMDIIVPHPVPTVGSWHVSSGFHTGCPRPMVTTGTQIKPALLPGVLLDKGCGAGVLPSPSLTRLNHGSRVEGHSAHADEQPALWGLEGTLINWDCP